MSNYYNRKQDMDEALNVPAEFCEWRKVFTDRPFLAACNQLWYEKQGNFCPNCGKPIREVKT